MKSGIHPENYRTVVFKDMSNGDIFFSRSTVNTKENIEIDGVFNNFKIKGYYINDCGLNGTQLEDINPYIIIDGGEV